LFQSTLSQQGYIAKSDTDTDTCIKDCSLYCYEPEKCRQPIDDEEDVRAVWFVDAKKKKPSTTINTIIVPL
jgi:hypothetical protein